MSENKKSAEQVEQERLTRRQALRKLGFGAGLSAIMLLGADDLARMVGERMRQMEGDNKVADQIAHEFQNAGIAFADSGDGASGTSCQHCWNEYQDENCWCASHYGPGDPGNPGSKATRCEVQAIKNRQNCATGCTGDGGPTSSGCTTYTQPPGWSG